MGRTASTSATGVSCTTSGMPKPRRPRCTSGRCRPTPTRCIASRWAAPGRRPWRRRRTTAARSPSATTASRRTTARCAPWPLAGWSLADISWPPSWTAPSSRRKASGCARWPTWTASPALPTAAISTGSCRPNGGAAAGAASRWPWCCWTSTISSSSTTCMATSGAMNACAPWPPRCAASSGVRTIWWRAMAARSSSACCPNATWTAPARRPRPCAAPCRRWASRTPALPWPTWSPSAWAWPARCPMAPAAPRPCWHAPMPTCTAPRHRGATEGKAALFCYYNDSFLRFTDKGGFKSKRNESLVDGIGLYIQPRQVLGIDLNGLAPAQRHPGSAIEFVSHGIELLLGINTQIGAFGEVLAQQPVGVLIAASLPGAVWVAEVDLHTGVFAEPGVLGHLAPSVVGQALAHGLGYCVELVGEFLQHMRRSRWIGVGELDQHHQARGALDQRANGAGVVRTLDEIALPVAWQLAILDLGRAHMDAQQILYLPTPILALGAGPALGMGHAQARQQLLLELSARLGIDAGVDALVRHALAPVIGVLLLQVLGNLLGRPVLVQVATHDLEQGAIAVQLGLGAGKAPAPVAALLGVLGGITLATSIALALTADGALASAQSSGNGAQAHVLLQAQRYCVALALAQLLVFLLCHLGLNSRGVALRN